MPRCFILLLAQQPPQARARGGRANRQRQLGGNPGGNPGGTPPNPASGDARRPRRGGSQSPGPAVGGEVDETPVVTHHSATVGGKTLRLHRDRRPDAAQGPRRRNEAHIFLYGLHPGRGHRSGPASLTFCFNGGPGSGVIWVHMGGMGRASQAASQRRHAPSPIRVERQPGHLVDLTDPGVHRPRGHGITAAPRTSEVAHRMNGVQGDFQSVGEFMRCTWCATAAEILPAVHRRRKVMAPSAPRPGRLPDRPWNSRSMEWC